MVENSELGALITMGQMGFNVVPVLMTHKTMGSCFVHFEKTGFRVEPLDKRFHETFVPWVEGLQA